MKTFLRILIGVTAVLALGACGPAAQPAGSEPASQTPKSGGVLHSPTTTDPYDWDVSFNGKATGNGEAMSLAYNSLLGFKAGPEVGYNDAVLAPELAEKWEVSPDARVFTFHLRKNVHFANLPPVNGRELTSGDVKWSYEYWTRTGQFKDKNLPKAYYDYMFDGMEAIETPDPYTAVVRFKEPSIPFLNYSAADHNHIAPHEIYDADGNLKTRIVGSGPFQLDEGASQKGTRYVWKKNPAYWDTGKPYVDELQWIVTANESAAFAAFQSRQLDMLGKGGMRLGFANTQELRKISPQAVFFDFETAFPQDFFMRLDKGPYADVRVRKALSLAVDRDEFMRTFQAGQGSWMMPGIFSGYFTQEEVKKYVRYDPGEAKRLLADAGHSNGVDVELTYPGTTYGDLYISQIQLLQAQLKRSGFNLDLKNIEPSTFSLNMKTASFMTMLLSGGDTRWDVNTALTKFLPDSKSNFIGANDPELTRLVIAQRSEVDPAKRRELVRQAAARIVEDAYGVGMFSVVNYEVWHPYVKGYVPNWNIYGWALENTWLEK